MYKPFSWHFEFFLWSTSLSRFSPFVICEQVLSHVGLLAMVKEMESGRKITTLKLNAKIKCSINYKDFGYCQDKLSAPSDLPDAMISHVLLGTHPCKPTLDQGPTGNFYIGQSL